MGCCPWVCHSPTLPVTPVHEPRAICEPNTRGHPTACHLPLAQPPAPHSHCPVHCSCSAGKLLGPPGTPTSIPTPALLLCSVRGSHRGTGTWDKLWPSHQTPAPHAALDGPSSASLPVHHTRGCSCSLPCPLLTSHPHLLFPHFLFFSFLAFFPSSCSRSHFILSTENTNTSTPKARPLLGWVCPGAYPGPSPSQLQCGHAQLVCQCCKGPW